MNKVLRHSVKFVKKEIKHSIQRKAKPVPAKPKPEFVPAKKKFPKLLKKGVALAEKILVTKKRKKMSSREFVRKNKRLLTKKNLESLFIFIFGEFSKNQINRMLLYIFGDISDDEKENVLTEIIEHINNKEYGFLLKD